MKKNFNKRNLWIVLFLTGLFFTVSLTEVKAETAYAITSDNQLLRFNTNSPNIMTTVGTVTGLQSGETILGIDFRPATGQLYALGSDSRIYTLNKVTGAANFVGALTTPLNGTSFGFDFNPVVDRIRIVSDADQNLRVNPNDGSNVVDGNLAFAAGDRNQGADPNIVGAAYSNNFSGTGATTLYDIDSNRDILVTQNPANSGTLQTIGKLGVDTTGVVGFDITSATDTAYALLTVAGFDAFYTINLSTGNAALVGLFGLPGITDIAVEIGTITNYTVFGVTTANNLVRFNSSRPNTIIRTTTITGLQAGENVLGIDFRPATGELYALGSNSRLYTVDTGTGEATFVADLSIPLNGTNFGFDFNPTVDRIRIVSNTDQNLRVNPADGSAIVDGTLVYLGNDTNAGRNPNIVASAYTNSFAGATSTTLYDIDSNLDTLVVQNPANSGFLATIGSLNVNTTGEVGFDIAPNNVAIAALQISGITRSTLYTINLATGSAVLVGPIGGGEVIRGIAVRSGRAAGSATISLDFDGDNRTDYALFRPANGNWLIRNSSNGSIFSVAFGAATDILTPGDYDGDGRTDIAVWRPADGTFYILRSSDGGFQAFRFGRAGDEPVARDYDGDGRTDFAVVRRENGVMTWIIQNSLSGNVRFEQFGSSSDRVAPGDYDGDGRFDVAVYRGAAGQPATFYVLRSTGGFMAVQWGLGEDLVVPGDYDGDGKTDFAVVRPGTPYNWYVLQSSDNSLASLQFGAKSHFTTQGDYDGDGRTDIAVYDPATAAFYVFQSSDGTELIVPFGQNGDYPVANFDTH